MISKAGRRKRDHSAVSDVRKPTGELVGPTWTVDPPSAASCLDIFAENDPCPLT